MLHIPPSSSHYFHHLLHASYSCLCLTMYNTIFSKQHSQQDNTLQLYPQYLPRSLWFVTWCLVLNTCCYNPQILEYQPLLGLTLDIYQLRAPTLRDHIVLFPPLTTIPQYELSPLLHCPSLKYHILYSLLQIVTWGGTVPLKNDSIYMCNKTCCNLRDFWPGFYIWIHHYKSTLTLNSMAAVRGVVSTSHN